MIIADGTNNHNNTSSNNSSNVSDVVAAVVLLLLISMHKAARANVIMNSKCRLALGYSLIY